jgi:hypothetical protein
MKMQSNVLLAVTVMTLLFAGACNNPTLIKIKPEPAVPVIINQPQGAVYSTGATAAVLTIDVSINDKGTLSYQWYSDTVERVSEGTPISGATETYFKPPTNEEGTFYYYVIVTNTLNGKTAQTSSIPAAIEVNNKVNAAVPMIIGQPQNAIYRINDDAVALTVTASASGEGTFSYQWYSNAKNSNEGGKIIPGAIQGRYTPSTTALGVVYYYVVVTYTIKDNGDGGNKTAQMISAVAEIEVNNKINAAVPDITVDPRRAVYLIDVPAVPLKVVASVNDGGTIRYRWYCNTKNSNKGGTVIPGASKDSYTPPTNEAGVMYYYVVITNTIEDNDDGGNKTAQAVSATARITVNLMPLTITGLSAADKFYDGTTDAAVTGRAELAGLLEGDDVWVVAGTAAFEDAKVGNAKTVTFSGYSLGGADAVNYSLSAQPTATANITPAALTLSVSKTMLSPIDTAAVITITDGLISNDTTSLSYSVPPAGISFDSNTLTYDGTTAFTNPGLTINFTSSNSNYSAATTIGVYDGQASARAIPVTSANITAFNTYARTANGLTRHYKLVQNITLAGSNNWTAIGASGSNNFTGSFDGQGYTISNLNINTTADYQGMFGSIDTGGIVKNLGLVGGRVSGGSRVGGIAGTNRAMVQNCYVTGNISGSDFVGGVVGHNNGGTVQNCYTTGNISSTGSSSVIGGVAGYNNTGTVQNCYATGNVSSTGSSSVIGGVAGRNSGMMQNCYATGNVSGGSTAGGVVGNNSSNTVQNCAALNPGVRKTSSGDTNIGRVMGNNSGLAANNYARSTGMTVLYNWNGIAGTNASISAGVTTKDGANVDPGTGANQYNNQNFWSNTMGWDFTDVWEWSVSKQLPILRGVGNQ